MDESVNSVGDMIQSPTPFPIPFVSRRPNHEPVYPQLVGMPNP